MRALVAGVLACLLAAPALAHKTGAHVHGEAHVRVVVDGTQLLIEFDSPLDSLVGFEHAPKNERQRAALARAEAALRETAALFALPAAAACVPGGAVELNLPWTASAAGEPARAAEHGGHSDMQASYVFECAAPQALTELRVNLFDAFPRLHRVRAETATPGGQGAATLDKARRRLPL